MIVPPLLLPMPAAAVEHNVSPEAMVIVPP